MRKFFNIFCVIFVIITMTVGNVLAANDENRYIVSKEMVYESTRRIPLSSGFVEVLVGNTNFTQYQIDNNIEIIPLPDQINTDEYGNQYAYYDLTGMLPGEKLNVTIKRDGEISTYVKDIPTRSGTIINEESKKYLNAVERIDSDDSRIVAKAKEITEDISTDYKKAQALFEFVNVNMSYDTSVEYANKGSLSALENLRGVCEEFATLYVAMCRSLDIPARAIEGYKLEDVYESGETSGEKIFKGKKLINHVWAEIYLADFGWVPVEPTIIYTVNGDRKPYLNSFCKMENPEYFAVGIYNIDKANRRIKGVEEVKYSESVISIDEVAPEIQNSFKDIEGVSWAAKDIQTLYSRGIVKGYSEEEYGPENNISRIEFITMLSRLLKYYDTQYESRGMVYYYPDYDGESHWSKAEYDYLLRCYQVLNKSDISAAGFDEISSIFGTGRLNPNKPITRAEVVALMDVFLDETDTAETSFSDVNWSTKFKDSIIKATANGLLTGYPDGSFKPNAPITRAEMAVILGRYINGNIYSMNY